jgi:anion-transporting  ArsA/GET3 family ATPase
VPGLEDYAMLGKTWFHTTEEEDGGRPKWDLVILDGPATGHLVTMLMIPQAILDAVPEGPLTRPAAATMALLRDPARAAMVLVTLAEDLPSNEVVELKHKIDETVRMPFGPLVVNMLYSPRFAQGPSARAVASLPEDVGDAELQPLVVTARTALRRRALNERYLERLRAAIELPQVQLPFLFAPRFGVKELDELAQRLEGQVAAAPEIAQAVGKR